MKSKNYEDFVEKFKPKRTTDDCYTPGPVYDAVAGWVAEEYGVPRDRMVRPFWPGADYTAREYAPGDVVVDNPPFSILSQVCAYYLDRGIKFFLFAPSLTALSGKGVCMRMNHIICNAEVAYENGAVVRTSFVTNLGEEGVVLQSGPELTRRVMDAVKAISKRKAQPKYDYPSHVVTAAMVQRYAKHGVDFKVRAEECVRISALDSQKEAGKTAFGSALLLSDAAAERRERAEERCEEAAEALRLSIRAEDRASRVYWPLSERERERISALGLSSRLVCGANDGRWHG